MTSDARPRRGRKSEPSCEACGAPQGRRQLDGSYLCAECGWPKRVDAFDILLKGDVVKVRGLPGEYKFLGLVTSKSGFTHAELYGGRGGQKANRGIHAVDPDRLNIPSQRKLDFQRQARLEKMIGDE